MRKIDNQKLKAQELLKEDPLRKPRSSPKPAKAESSKKKAKMAKYCVTPSASKPSSSKIEAVYLKEKTKFKENTIQQDDVNKKKKTKKSKKRSRDDEDVKLHKKIRKEKEKRKSVSLSSTNFFKDPATISKVI
jgi:DNA repair exonuclease SbcCD nuclease subunit